MVHGAFCGGWALEILARPFEAEGYKVLRPDLPGHAPHDPPRAVAGRSMSDYVADIVGLCRSQAEPPILIGHSLGGLVAMLAASRTPVQALAVLAPSAPWGVPVASLEEAVYMAALFEHAARLHLLAAASGAPLAPIDPDRAREAHDFLLKPKMVSMTVDYWLRQTARRHPDALTG